MNAYAPPLAPTFPAHAPGHDGRTGRYVSSLLLIILVAVLGVVVLGFGSFSPSSTQVSQPVDDGLVFEAKYGAQTYIPAGSRSAVDFPTVIRFLPGQTANITLINNDTVRHLIGPYLVDPGQKLVVTFPNPGVYPIDCSVNHSESITVIVEK